MKDFFTWLSEQGTAGNMGVHANPRLVGVAKQAATAAQVALQRGDKDEAIKANNDTVVQALQQGKIQPKDLNDLLADNPTAGNKGPMNKMKKMRKK